MDAVRLNTRTASPFDFNSDLMEPYYAAYRTFSLILESPEFQIRFKLDPGDLYIVDNTQVMHGRTEFSAIGNRHIQGCYADRYGLYSQLRVLNRTKWKSPAFGECGVVATRVALTEHSAQAT